MNHHSNVWDPDAKPEREELLCTIALASGGKIEMLAEYWARNPKPSLRFRRTNRTGGMSGFSISQAHRAAVSSAVAAWLLRCDEAATGVPGATSREQAADARVEAERARRGGR